MRIHPVGERWPVTGAFMASDGPWSPERPHLGVDFGAPKGTPVYAPDSGVVVAFTNDGSFGARSVCLMVDHDPEYPCHLFAHLQDRTVGIGEHVKRGQLIGWVGGWGINGPDTYAPHLHWQRCKSNFFARDIAMNADPLAWLKEDEVTREEFEALTARVAAVEETVRRIDNDGVILYKDGQGYDVIQPIRDLNTALKAHIETEAPE